MAKKSLLGSKLGGKLGPAGMSIAGKAKPPVKKSGPPGGLLGKIGGVPPGIAGAAGSGGRSSGLGQLLRTGLGGTGGGLKLGKPPTKGKSRPTGRKRMPRKVV